MKDLREIDYAWIFKYEVKNKTLFYKKIEYGVKKEGAVEDLALYFPETSILTDSAIKQINQSN